MPILALRAAVAVLAAGVDIGCSCRSVSGRVPRPSKKTPGPEQPG